MKGAREINLNDVINQILRGHEKGEGGVLTLSWLKQIAVVVAFEVIFDIY